VFHILACVFAALDVSEETARGWRNFTEAVTGHDVGAVKLLPYLTSRIDDAAIRVRYDQMANELTSANPHALYPTSPYRMSSGRVNASSDERTVEAVMIVSTFALIKVVDHVLDPADPTLRDLYSPLCCCVCFIDSNVDKHCSEPLAAYFAAHGIALEKLVHRAMEVDKGIATIEKMLGQLKQVGIARHEPVLIMGGGVLADTGGLACAL